MSQERVVRPTPVSMSSRAPSAADRADLAAALAFLDEPLRDAAGLLAWFDLHVVARGVGERPARVAEAPVGVLELDDAEPSASLLPLAVDTARARVRTTLRRLGRTPADDRFVTAAIFRRDVARVSSAASATWRATPREGLMLSDLVLTFFAADVLAHRDAYDRTLSICDVCERVSFVADRPDRSLCDEHRAPAALPGSGVFRR